VSDVLVADLCDADAAGDQAVDAFDPVLAVVHVDGAVEDHEDPWPSMTCQR
jgi:hypothetical protein